MSEHFKVGTIVALCNSGGGWGQRSITKREVYKVHKNGRFFVKFTRIGAGGEQEVVHSDTMWTPDRFGGPEAQKAGERGYCSREYIEVWTEKHDQELAERRAARAAQDRKNELLEVVQNLDTRSLSDRYIIEEMLKLVPAKEEQSNV